MKKEKKKMLDRLTRWFDARLKTNKLKAMRGRDARKVMIAYAKEQGT